MVQKKEIPWLTWTMILLIITICLTLLSGCADSPPEPPILWPANLKGTPARPASQNMIVEPKRDTLLVGEQGTIIFVPTGALITAEGEIPTGPIEVTLVETFSKKDFILAGLSATSGDELLETGRMVFLNATARGEQLQINPEIPLYLEIPAARMKEGMMAFSGEWGTQGINWQDPVPAEKWLIPVPLKTLDFHADPPSDSSVARTGISFSVPDPADNPLVDAGNQIADLLAIEGTGEEGYEQGDTAGGGCGISRDFIDLLYSEEYENTLIATREFERRMRSIHWTCDEDLLKLYLNNLGLNLWEIDSLAADYLAAKGNYLHRRFRRFSAERLTRMKAGPEAEVLQNFLSQELVNLEENREQAAAPEAERAEAAYQAQRRYHQACKGRLVTNAFLISRLGWINVDQFLDDPEAEFLPLVVEAMGAPEVKEVQVMMVFRDISSVFKLAQDKSGLFYCGDPLQGKENMRLPRGMRVDLVATGWDGETALLGIKETWLGEQERMLIKMEPMTDEAFELALKPYGIQLNLPAPLVRQVEERPAFCCENAPAGFFSGEELFLQNCASCHHTDLTKDMTGPALYRVEERVPSYEWLVEYTRNPEVVIMSGDEYANMLYEEWNKTQMTPMPHLSDKDIDAIYMYIRTWEPKMWE